MEMEKEYACLERNSCIFSKNIDCDDDFQESLAQYCDDILKVVKCVSHSYVTSVDTSYNEIKIYGKTEIKLTYYNDNSVLSYADFTEDFYKNVSVENLSDQAFSFVNVTDKYTNFRVINQRRIDVHTSRNIQLKIFDRVKSPCLSSCENSKLKIENLKTSQVIQSGICKAEFEEEFSIAVDEAIKRIISCSSYTTLNEIKSIKDKALVKSTLNISVLYTTDTEVEEIKKCQYSVEISKIVEINGLEETDIIIAQINTGNIFLKPKSSVGDKLNVIEAVGEISISFVAIREQEQTLITDGYVLNKKSSCQYSDYKCINNSKYIRDSVSRNLLVEFSGTFSEIKDLSVKLNECHIKCDKLVISAVVSIFCINNDCGISYINSEECIEIEVGNFSQAISAVSIQSFDYSIKTESKVDLRITVALDTYVYDENNFKILSEINVEDRDDETPVLTIYFSKNNETLWDIAKNFSTDINLIMKENDLPNECIESGKILLIPGM